jgi:hypothetical protein
MGCKAVQSGSISPTFRGHINSVFWVDEQTKETTNKKQVASRADCLVYSSTMNMEAVLLSKMSVNFYRAIQRYIPQDCNIQNGCMIVDDVQ